MISTTQPSTKMFPNFEGTYVPIRIQWNKSTRAWHIYDNRGTLRIHTGTIIPGTKGYALISKHWEYDPTHPEKVAYYKLPHINNSQHVSLTEALATYALGLDSR